MVKIELRSGKVLNVKYKLLVKSAYDNMTPVEDLSEFQNAMTKTAFIRECLREMGKLYNIQIRPSDMVLPNYEQFGYKIVNQLRTLKSRDCFFVSHNFTGIGWRLVKIDIKTDKHDVKRINAEYQNIIDRIKKGIDNKEVKRNLLLGIDPDKDKLPGY